MSYLIYRQLNYALGKWADETRQSRNIFAKKNNLQERTGSLNWKDTEELD